ncbi:MAG TPA: ABC transporter substrate-binding protein [Terriglobia bacterium]|nr:ABC transporter substrate-binding protein [Terriglobia bacterium]
MNERLRIMVYRHSAFYTPLIGAIAAGFLRDVGLETEYFTKPKGRNHYEMFRNGEVDIMQAAVSSSWDPLSRGITDIPKHFAQINQRDGFFIAARNPAGSPFDWRMLEGAALVADHAQQPLAMLKHAGRLRGVDWSRVRLINAGAPDDMQTAFLSGVGDFIHLQGPSPQQLEMQGAARVVARVGEAIPTVAFSTLMAMPNFLSSPQAAAFMVAYRRALAWANDAPAAEIAEAEAPFFDNAISREALESAVAEYQRLGTWRRDPAIPRDQYETAMHIFIAEGVFDRWFPYETVVLNPPVPL